MRLLLISVFLSNLVLNSITYAENRIRPSFDCKKASTDVERIICNNETLADLDKKLDAAFFELKKNPKGRLKVSVDELIKNQKEWLKNRGKEEDGECLDRGCLVGKYKERLIELSFPGASSNINQKKLKELERFFMDKDCESFEAISKNNLMITEGLDTFACKIYEINPSLGDKLFSNCYGSNRDNFTPHCDFSHFSSLIKKVDGLKDYTDHLRFLYTPNPRALGTMQFGQYRDQYSAILTALNDTTNIQFPENRKSQGPDLLLRFSAKGLWEKEQYQKYLNLKTIAQKGLEKYYNEVKKVPLDTARKAAKFHVDKLVDVYISSHYTSRDTWNLNELNHFLKNGTLPDDINYSYDINLNLKNKSKEEAKPEILAYLLKLAVVNDYSKNDIEKIISAGANLNSPNVPDNALMNSIKRPDILMLLIEKGANVNAQNQFGKTALMYAIQFNNLEAIKILIDHHADINLATFEHSYEAEAELSAGKRTPLMYAAWHANDEVVKYLLSKGAKTDAKDTEGHDYQFYLKQNDYQK